MWGSFVLALCGWVGSLVVWQHFGVEAGIRPSFIMALTMAATFTMTLCATVLMPEKARMYSLGYRDGVAQGLAMQHEPEPKLSVVR